MIFHVVWSLELLFCIWRSSHLTCFDRYIPSVSSVRDWGFLRLFYGYACSSFVLLPWGKFLRLYVFSLSCAKLGRVLTASGLLSLRWCWIIKFVCFLSIPQTWDTFLHVLSSCLQRLAHAALRGAFGASNGWECFWVRCMESLGYLFTSWGHPQTRLLVIRLPDEVCIAVSRIHVSFSVFWEHCCSPIPSPSPSHVVHLNILGGVNTQGVSWAVFCTTGKLGARSHHLIPLRGEVSLRSLLALRRAAVGEGGVSGKVTLFLSPSRSVPNLGLLFSYFFCSNGVLELFHGLPDFHNYTVVHWWLSKSVFFGRKMIGSLILLFWWCCLLMCFMPPKVRFAFYIILLKWK